MVSRPPLSFLPPFLSSCSLIPFSCSPCLSDAVAWPQRDRVHCQVQDLSYHSDPQSHTYIKNLTHWFLGIPGTSWMIDSWKERRNSLTAFDLVSSLFFFFATASTFSLFIFNYFSLISWDSASWQSLSSSTVTCQSFSFHNTCAFVFLQGSFWFTFPRHKFSLNWSDSLLPTATFDSPHPYRNTAPSCWTTASRCRDLLLEPVDCIRLTHVRRFHRIPLHIKHVKHYFGYISQHTKKHGSYWKTSAKVITF